MPAPEIRYDHDNMEQVAKSLLDLADRMEADLREKTQKLMDEARKEASHYTADGAPAPIYKDVLDKARLACEALMEKVAEIAATMRRDAELLLQGSAKAEEIAGDAAAGIDGRYWDGAAWGHYKM